MQGTGTRVNGALLSDYRNRMVTVIGKWSQEVDSAGRTMIVCSDGKCCGVEMPPGESQDVTSEFVQVYGKVTESADGGVYVSAFRTNDAGSNFDMETHNKAIELLHGKYSHLFL